MVGIYSSRNCINGDKGENMKKSTWITVGLTALLPMAGLADITVNAAAQSTGYAYIYDTAGSIIRSANFVGGVATIDTDDSLAYGQYGLAMVYEGGSPWISNIGYGASSAYKTFGAGHAETFNSITGQITSRGFSATSTTVRLNANGDQSIYNNFANEISAYIGVYRPSATLSEVGASNVKLKTVDLATLGGTYGYTAVPWAEQDWYTLITVTDSAGDFSAEYLGRAQGGDTYELRFTELVGGDVLDGNGSVQASSATDLNFTLNSGVAATDDGTPYYVMMDKAWMYDDTEANNGNYSETYDSGVVLTSPDHYVIPEPAVLALVMGGGGLLLVGRRISNLF